MQSAKVTTKKGHITDLCLPPSSRKTSWPKRPHLLEKHPVWRHCNQSLLFFVPYSICITCFEVDNGQNAHITYQTTHIIRHRIEGATIEFDANDKGFFTTKLWYELRNNIAMTCNSFRFAAFSMELIILA